MARTGFQKQDRMARMLHVLMLLAASPRGMTTQQLADEMGVNQRTAQRDMRALEEIGVPLYKNDSRWAVLDTYLLRGVNFGLHEAMAMLLAARLMLRYAGHRDHFTVGAFQKLAAVLPEPLKSPLLDTAAALKDKPEDARYTKAIATLTSAWAERRKVRITYASGGETQRTVWPLFLEPSAIGHSCYLIAHDEKSKAIRSFKVERIQAVKLLEQRFDPPLGFDVGKHLANAWTIWSSTQPVDVELLFAASVAERVLETPWHPSQRTDKLEDGRVRMRLTVASTVEIRHWILGWGDTVEVVEPEELRHEIKEIARAMARLYEPADAAFRRLVTRAG